jgi:hypothetical protein
MKLAASILVGDFAHLGERATQVALLFIKVYIGENVL